MQSPNCGLLVKRAKAAANKALHLTGPPFLFLRDTMPLQAARQVNANVRRRGRNVDASIGSMRSGRPGRPSAYHHW